MHLGTINEFPSDIERAVANQAPPEPSHQFREWQSRMNKAIYRAIIINAVQARSYIEPFIEATRRPIQLDSDEDFIKFLLQFPVFDLDPSPENDNRIYNNLGIWLRDTTLADSTVVPNF